jgi:serine/threonine protein kinase
MDRRFLGTYALERRLGVGGMGEVWLARRAGQLVVVKTLLPHLAHDAELITMFEDEARIASRLDHPNVCRAFGLERADGVHFLALEYVPGGDLRALAKACAQRGLPLPPELACRIVADAAAGLHYAHSLRDPRGQPYGIVHRDVSPQNILVTPLGAVKVIDFGVAKATGRAQRTAPGVLKGKLEYMSPEQVASREVDARSDVFALGIVLHELLTGENPFKGESDASTLARLRACVVPPPSSVEPRVPGTLDELVLRALSKDRERRFQSAGELRRAIDDWLARSTQPAQLAGFLRRLREDDFGLPRRLAPG